jgi:hypothetical protein
MQLSVQKTAVRLKETPGRTAAVLTNSRRKPRPLVGVLYDDIYELSIELCPEEKDSMPRHRAGGPQTTRGFHCGVPWGICSDLIDS